MSSYQDTDLVYVDADQRKVLGLVQWAKNGNPKPLEKPVAEASADGKKGKSRRKKEYFPWGTYRTMKRLYRLEGKEKALEQYQSLDAALSKAVQEPFWD